MMTTGAKSGTRYQLVSADENLLGRDWQCRVVLNDPQCSRVHASIFSNEDGWWLEDRDSSNGTFVNGQRVKEAQLMDGTEVRIGACKFTFVDNPDDPSVLDEPDAVDSSQTVILDEAFDASETGQYTLEFLKNHNWGEDFFFLFQLSVKLLSVDNPDEVVQICVRRLFDRTQASVSGFMWLTDHGQLTPKFVYPEKRSKDLELNERLTKRVINQKHAIRIEHSSSVDGKGYADSICSPLIIDDEVVGALHLYSQANVFRDEQFQLAKSVSNIMSRSLDRANRQASLQADHDRLAAASGDSSELIGDSEPMLNLKSKIKRIAKATGCVLVRGESGAGKELVARALHRASPRSNRPMLSVNCAAIPRDLMESQLFGHKKGSFTSADSDHIGWFQQADTGTLFLDEIGELTLEGQAKLLRILEGHPFLPVGGTEEVTVDVRVICATNRDLREFVNDKKFREDLFYRLTVFELSIPPLRDRGSDIQLLIDFFLDHFTQNHGRPGLELSKSANEKLLSFQWPGNVRQLRNVIDSAIVMAEGEQIEIEDLGIRDVSGDELESLKIDYWERKLIKQALKRTSDNVPKAAALLGISRATLYRKIDEYSIERK